MATFHPFPRLPPELRHQIWNMTLVPRTVEMRPRSLFGRNPRVQSCPRYLEFFDKSNVAVASTPPPAILHACSESRIWAANRLYRRAFINDFNKFLEIGMPDTNSPWVDRTVVAMEWRHRKAMLKSPLYGSYVWMNFDIDTVSFRGLQLFPQKNPLAIFGQHSLVQPWFVPLSLIEGEKERLQCLRLDMPPDTEYNVEKMFHRFTELRKLHYVPKLPWWLRLFDLVTPKGRRAGETDRSISIIQQDSLLLIEDPS